QRLGLRLYGLQLTEDPARQIPRSELVRLPADRALHPALPLRGARVAASVGRSPWTARDALVPLATGGGRGLPPGEGARPTVPWRPTFAAPPPARRPRVC